MTDMEIAAVFQSVLLPAMAATPGLAGVKLARNYQNRTHGANTSAYVYYFKIGPDHRYGHVARQEVYDETNQVFTHTETQIYESTYQLMAQVPQDPANVTRLTESDILNLVSGIMQSDAILAAFRAAGAGILRITDVRNPQNVLDRDQFEAVPNFDIVLTHKRVSVSTIPAVVTYDANVSRV